MSAKGIVVIAVVSVGYMMLAFVKNLRVSVLVLSDCSNYHWCVSAFYHCHMGRALPLWRKAVDGAR